MELLQHSFEWIKQVLMFFNYCKFYQCYGDISIPKAKMPRSIVKNHSFKMTLNPSLTNI